MTLAGSEDERGLKYLEPWLKKLTGLEEDGGAKAKLLMSIFLRSSTLFVRNGA